MEIHLFLLGKQHPSSFGGMESHYHHFVHFFKEKHPSLTFHGILSCGEEFIYQNSQSNEIFSTKDLVLFLEHIAEFTEENTVFFCNDGHWITYLPTLKKKFPLAYIMMRSGGNEFLSAKSFGDDFTLKQRQEAWATVVTDCVSMVVANSLFTVERMVHLGFPPEKITLIRGGVSTEYCKENQHHRETLRASTIKKYGITTPFLFVVAARMVAFKGLSLLISAVSKSPYAQEITLIFVGTGGEEPQLKQQCYNDLPQGQYFFLGECGEAETLALIACGDVYCNTSLALHTDSFGEKYIHTETMGRSMMEALLENIPLLATDVGGTGEVFLEFHYGGVLVAPKESAVISGIVALIEGEKRNCSPMETVDYSWEAIFSQYLAEWKQHFSPPTETNEMILEERPWSLCCRQEDFFRKYYKHATAMQVKTEAACSHFFYQQGVSTPKFLKTGYSTYWKMYYNQYQYQTLTPIPPEEVPKHWGALEKIVEDIQKNNTMPLWVQSKKTLLPEQLQAIERVEKVWNKDYSLEKDYLQSLKEDVLCHGDYSLVNLFYATEQDKVVVVDFQHCALGHKKWDFSYLLATLNPETLPNSIILPLSAEDLFLITVIALIKVGRGLRKEFALEQRTQYYKNWRGLYEKSTGF